MRLLIDKVKKLMMVYVKKEIVGVLLTILYSVLTFMTPKVSAYLVDEVIPAKSMEKLAIGVGMFVIICLLQPLIGCMKDYVFIYITENITYDIRNRLYTKIINADFKFIDQTKSGDLISIIMGDGRAVSEFISNLFAILLKDGLMIFMIIIGMLSIDWKTSLIVFFVFVFSMSIQIFFKNRIRKISNEIQTNYDNMCTCISQTNKMITYIKMENQETNTINKYKGIINKIRKDNISLDRTTVLINNITSIIVVLCLGIIYTFGAIAVMRREMTIGNVIAMGLYFQLLANPLYELMGIGIDTNVLIPIFERLEKYENLPNEKSGKFIVKKNIENVKIEHLEFQRKDKIILSNISINFPPRGIVYITGESGTGKSTLVKLLLGMYSVNENMIKYNGRDIGEYNIKSLRNKMSYVPQDCDLFNESIMFNLTYGVTRVDRIKVVELCKTLRIHSTISCLKNGYDSVVTEKVNLSGGEKQRILLARALLKDSDIIILDEPLSSLDEDNITTFGEVISDIARNKLVIMVTHQECSSIIPDKVFLLNNGIVEEKLL